MDLKKIKIGFSPLSGQCFIFRHGKDPEVALDKREATPEVQWAIVQLMMHDAPKGASQKVTFGEGWFENHGKALQGSKGKSMSHTYAILEISPEAFEEIRSKLEAAGYQHAFTSTARAEWADDRQQPIIDMHGLALAAQSPIEHLAIVNGKVLHPCKTQMEHSGEQDILYCHTHEVGICGKHRGACGPTSRDGQVQCQFAQWPFMDASGPWCAVCTGRLAPDAWVRASEEQQPAGWRHSLEHTDQNQILLCRTHDFGICGKHRNECGADRMTCHFVPWPKGEPWCAVCCGRLAPLKKENEVTSAT